MSVTLKNHQDNQTKVIHLLSKLEGFITQGHEFGLNISADVKNKLNNSLKSLQDDKLKIALIGGFSEGKTSIAAAWLGKIDPATMNISAMESSNSVKIYDIDENYQLIDTPGLYGYKEQVNTDVQEIEKYKDITKKYVSEAHIVLYVMNSKNPIKESHIDDLKWLFKELNLLPRTVFVLSRFDEVADVEDELDYQDKFRIKEQNVKERLTSILSLSIQDINNLHIVAVSANPFDEGVDYWMENRAEFEQLSHIKLLQNATSEIVKNNGGYNGLIEETRKSIISDILIKKIPEIEEKQLLLSKEMEKLNQIYELETGSLNVIAKRITYAKTNLKASFNGYFQDLIMQMEGTSLETISDFLIREIGDEGCIISSRINEYFEDETNQINISLNTQAINFNAEIDNIDTAVGSLTKKGLNHLAKNIKLDGNTIKVARDGLVAGGKFIGLNLKDALKFKPWGAINLASNLNKALPLIGIAIDAWDTWSQAKKQEEFQIAKKELKANFQKQQKEILELIDSEKFVIDFFPIYTELKAKIDEIKSIRQDHSEKNEAFKSWRDQGVIIEGEFRSLN
ncbi:LeoA/HP0731 family dynamin-like GTPase [Acinetobacter piscicola]|uniref:LeoA/HP0731 family dynamin-like GTPase n=1 Tax=Acinetobacter piscicola TaxID=2006115 RepID=UPI00102200E6|nr:LeoA/HP0731 family dynamin-like GTPase [Acinetobacter piscicola]RYL29669.1 labile enterotoxin output A [Acinetobacter piscicola]